MKVFISKDINVPLYVILRLTKNIILYYEYNHFYLLKHNMEMCLYHIILKSEYLLF